MSVNLIPSIFSRGGHDDSVNKSEEAGGVFGCSRGPALENRPLLKTDTST
jgi:hypothetical protein